MLKICVKPICKPFEVILQSCIKHGKFSNQLKIANVVHVPNVVQADFKELAANFSTPHLWKGF